MNNATKEKAIEFTKKQKEKNDIKTGLAILALLLIYIPAIIFIGFKVLFVLIPVYVLFWILIFGFQINQSLNKILDDIKNDKFEEKDK